MSIQRVLIGTLIAGLAAGGYALSTWHRVPGDPPASRQADDDRSADSDRHPRDTITLASGFPEDQSVYTQLEHIHAEAFTRLGHKFTLIALPAERSLLEANDGNIDGCAARTPELDVTTKYPNLIKVDEQVSTLTLAAYAIGSSKAFDDWPSFATADGPVGIVRGHNTIEERLFQHAPQATILVCSRPDQAWQLLITGRIQVLVSGPSMETLSEVEIGKHDIRCVGELEELPFCAYLHRKHGQLVPKLATTLKEMKQDGSFQQCIDRATLEWEDRKQ